MLKRILASLPLLVLPALADREVKEFSIVVEDPVSEYTVPTGGAGDPENVEVTIENLSAIPLVNPRITVNGLYDWYDTASIAAEITRGSQTDEEKAMAIWAWVRYRTYQQTVSDRTVLNPVRGLNGYGYGVCGHTAAWLKCLATAAGLKARIQELWGHTVAEIYFNGGWRFLDSNAKAFYLSRDNRAIASLAELERDRDLIERTIHPRELEPWVIGPDTPDRTRQFVNYLISSRDNYVEESYDKEIEHPYNMTMTLRPGEKLVRWWTAKLGKFARNSQREKAPLHYANGQIVWEPDLTKLDIRPYLAIPSFGNVATGVGNVPAIRPAEPQDSLYTRPSLFSIPARSPYPIVGGHFSCTLIREGRSPLDQVSIFFGKPGWLGRGTLYESSGEQALPAVDVNLDSKIMSSGERYEYAVGFALRANGETKPSGRTGVTSFRMVTDLQVAAQSLPALSRGKNHVRFWHQSDETVRVRITHRWKENPSRPPSRIVAAVSPAEGSEVSTLTPRLHWAAPGDPDVTDYQVMVCLRPDCRWPLSTTLQQNVGSAETGWNVPASFLNPGTTYYWKVRARNSRGVIGDWGQVFRFRTRRSTVQ